MDFSFISALLVEQCKSCLNLSHIELGREYYYKSLSYCVLDAVFSIGSRYCSTENTVNRYIQNTSGGVQQESHTLEDMVKIVEDRGIDDFAVSILGNRQRTSPRNGILKAQAAYEVAKILVYHGIETKKDFQTMNRDVSECVDKEILCVKGQGSGIMLKYLYMLAGDENKCKPDRQLKRFIRCMATGQAEQIAEDINAISDENTSRYDDKIQAILEDAVEDIRRQYRELTIRTLDYAIWSFQKTQPNKC